MKKTAIISALLLSSLGIQAQSGEGFIKHLDISGTIGTTGIGLDLSAQFNDYLRMRVGGSYMPRFHYVTDFGIEVGDDKEKSDERFKDLSKKLEEMTGFKVDRTIDMRGAANFNNFRVMVDVFPFKRKNFYVTAGFYAGGSKVAKAVNTTEDMPSLMAASIYNNMYNKIWQYMEGDGTYGTDSEGKPHTSLFMGVELSPDQYQHILDIGKMGMPLGCFKGLYETDEDGNILMDKKGNPKGKSYKMEPDENSMVSATAIVNKFRPYVGLGYVHPIGKAEKWNMGFDAGVIFWGGSPKLKTHDGTDMVHDIVGLTGKIGKYTDVVRALHVFPTLNFTLSRRFF